MSDLEQLNETKHYQSITNNEQMLWYLNAQNLVSTWNNIIIHAKTGEEQLKIMHDSGVYAEDLKLTFDFGDKKLEFTGLRDEPLEFYTQFVNGLKKSRANIASNIQVVEFGADFLRFNFKHWIFMNETLSLIGENQCVMNKEGDKYFLSSVYIKVILFNTEHAY